MQAGMHMESWLWQKRGRGAEENIQGGRINRLISWCWQRLIPPWTNNPYCVSRSMCFLCVCGYEREVKDKAGQVILALGQHWEERRNTVKIIKKNKAFPLFLRSLMPPLPLLRVQQRQREREDADLLSRPLGLTFLQAQHVETERVCVETEIK